MRVPIDIETIPQQPADQVKAEIAETILPPAQMSKPETIAEWHAGAGKYAGVKDAAIEEQYRKTSFNGALGQICSLAWAIEFSEPKSLFAVPGERTEADILSEFFADLRSELNGRPPEFVGHFVGGFDLPFLYQRAVINRVNPQIDLGQWGRHGREFFDTMVAWAGWKGTISLDNLCKALGIDIPGPEGLEGSTVWDFYQDGKYAEIEEYNRIDVLKVQRVLQRLQFQA